MEDVNTSYTHASSHLLQLHAGICFMPPPPLVLYVEIVALVLTDSPCSR